MESKSAEKKIERISKQQKQKLVEYMSFNLDFARGQFNANCNPKQQWESLRVTLNSLGGSEKTVEQWKKCWIDLKSGVKKSINARRKCMNQTDEDSWANVPRDLNPIDKQILQIITVDADTYTPESGVKTEESSEEYESFEFIDCEDEVGQPPPKRPKPNAFQDLNPSSSSKAYENRKLPLSPPLKPASKYTDALDEAREMQKALVDQLNRIEAQNKEILNKLDSILG